MSLPEIKYGKITYRYGPPDPLTFEVYVGPVEIYYGVYKCQRCAKTYTVNDQWAPCTPEFCHDCTAYLAKQYALIPVDEHGKDRTQ